MAYSVLSARSRIAYAEVNRRTPCDCETLLDDGDLAIEVVVAEFAAGWDGVGVALGEPEAITAVKLGSARVAMSTIA